MASGEIHVVAGILIKKDFVLAAQRKASGSLPLKWEFPGGKVEHLEDPEDCLCRELLEELNIRIEVGEFFTETLHSYHNQTIRLTSYIVNSYQGQIEARDHNDLKWVLPAELRNFDFAEADLPIIEKILSEGIVHTERET